MATLKLSKLNIYEKVIKRFSSEGERKNIPWKTKTINGTAIAYSPEDFKSIGRRFLAKYGTLAGFSCKRCY